MSSSTVQLVQSPSGVEWLEAALLSELAPKYRHFVSLRGGGMSTGRHRELNLSLGVEDQAETVLKNRLLLFGSLEVLLSQAIFCKQTHEAKVVTVDSRDRGKGAWRHDTALPRCDALITNSVGVCITVLLADCVPVLAIDPNVKAVGVAHAGWRGTVSGVTSAMISEMVTQFGTSPRDVRVAIGPSISPTAYEVGPEVVERASLRFADRIKDVVADRDGRLFFDLWRANQIELEAAGVVEENISIMGIGTEDRSNGLYSERAEGRPCGRFAAGLLIAPAV